MTRRGDLGSRVARLAMALAAASFTSIAGEGAAQAQQDALTATPSRRIVEVHVAGAGADAASLDDTMRELLGRLTLIMESQAVGRIEPDDASFRSTARPSLLARVGIDLRARDTAVVTIVDGRTGEITVRRSVRRDGPPAVVREELAHVVQAAIDPMVVIERDRANAAAVAPPPPPAPAPVEPPAVVPTPAPAPAPDEPPARDVATSTPEGARSPLALDLSTTAGASSYASGAGVVPRAGLGAALVLRRGLRPSLGATAHYLFPFEAGPEPSLAHVGVAALRGTAGLEVYGSRAFAIDVAAGAGVDVVRVEARSRALPADRLGDATTRVNPVVMAGATGHLAVGAGTSLSLTLAADIDLTSRHWVVETDSGLRSDVFAPARVRPVAMLGFTFTPLGDSRFAARQAAR